MAREAGADISDAVNKCVGSISKEKQIEDCINLAVNHSLPDRADKVLYKLLGKVSLESVMFETDRKQFLHVLGPGI